MFDLSENKYGHNLDNLLKQAENLNIDSLISLSQVHKSEIIKASEYYAAKVFEYPAILESLEAYPKLPDLSILIESANILVEKLKEPCLHHK